MDKETVIKGCENWVNNHKDENLLLTYSSVVELLDVLKEQEAVEPRNTYSTTPSRKVIPHIFCGKCNKEIYAIYTFCPFCGRQVKWK